MAQPSLEDVVFLVLRFPGGRLGHVHLSWLDPLKVRCVSVVGERAMAVFDDMAATEKLRLIRPRGPNPGADRSVRVVRLAQREPLREELIPRILQSGFRADPEVGHGTGLGLSIVQRLLGDLGGSIVVTSERGKWTRTKCRFRCLEVQRVDGARSELSVFDLIEISVKQSLEAQAEAEDDTGDE